MTALASRLAKAEAAVAATRRPPERTRAQIRESVAAVSGIEAAIVAYFLGGWRPGGDGFACVLDGIAASHTGGMTRSLSWACYKAERVHSGQLGVWHSAERLNAAFQAIGPHRHRLLSEIGDVLDRAYQIGDPTLIKIAAEPV